MSSSVIRIGLALTHNLAYCRGILRGINDYAESQPHWVLVSIEPDLSAVRALARLKPAGVIGHLFTDELVRAVRRLKTPLVNVSGATSDPIGPRVGVDDEACGRAAAVHLLDRGLQHFAFVGRSDQRYSCLREQGFRETVEARGFRVATYHEAARYHVVREDPQRILWLDRHVRTWMQSLPRPLGLFVANDVWGVEMTEVCRQIGLHVPEDVAIIGVHNDDLLCSLARPSLSSVPVPSERIGFEAAALLDRMFHGRPAPDKPLLLPPGPVIARRSSDILAIADAEVAAAVHFIREHAHQPLRVDEVVAQVPVSRRVLERRFRVAMGRSMLDEIRRVHLDRACRLLAETDLPMYAIADRSGFSDARQFSIVFRQFLGQTPGKYRRASSKTSYAPDAPRD